jgi:hypothetical protein
MSEEHKKILPKFLVAEESLRRFTEAHQRYARLPALIEVQQNIDRLTSAFAGDEIARVAETLGRTAAPLWTLGTKASDALSDLGRAASSLADSPLIRAADYANALARVASDAGRVGLMLDTATRNRESSLEAATRGLQPLLGNDVRSVAVAFENEIRGIRRLQDLRPWFEELDSAIRIGADEGSDGLPALTLSDTFEAVLDGIVGVDVHNAFSSPKQRLTALLKIAVFLWAVYQWQQGRLLNADVRELRRIQRQQAETIAAATEAVRRLTDEVQGLKNQSPAIHLEVAEDGILREGPSGRTTRVGRVHSGQVVRLLSVYGRWRYVEVLDANLQESDIRGWLYRRNVRVPRSRRK